MTLLCFFFDKVKHRFRADGNFEVIKQVLEKGVGDGSKTVDRLSTFEVEFGGWSAKGQAFREVVQEGRAFDGGGSFPLCCCELAEPTLWFRVEEGDADPRIKALEKHRNSIGITTYESGA